MSFSTFGLSASIIDAIRTLGFEAPTPIQCATILPALHGQDVLGCAPTGSGKTLAFALPLLQRLQQGQASGIRQVQALVLVPTRELATQVGSTLRELAQHLPNSIKISVVFGGVSINPQMMALRSGTDLLVATPGRLLDLLTHHAVTLSGVKMLVLDEADRLLDSGFSDELGQVLEQLSCQRQNLFFSATFPPLVQQLANTLLHQPVCVDVRPDTSPPTEIVHRAIAVDPPKRNQMLRHLIEYHHWSQVLVFVATKFAAEIVADKLRKGGLSAEPFHGDLSQGKRTQVLNDFKATRLGVVVATDVAARGLDIAQLPVVLNFDLPRSVNDYTHRVGRTGRAGQPGLAVSFVSAETLPHWRLIVKRQHLPVTLESLAGFAALQHPAAPSSRDPNAVGNGGIKGARPSKKDKLRAQAARGQPAVS